MTKNHGQELVPSAAPLPPRPAIAPPPPPPASGAAPTPIPEYLPGQQEGTLHRVENGRRTGVMWGPSVEGNWYASLARIADGYTFKFVEQSHAEAFLRAVINPNPAAYTHPMHYSYRIGKYRHLMWYTDPAEAHRSAGDEEHQLIAEPCPCMEPHPEDQQKTEG